LRIKSLVYEMKRVSLRIRKAVCAAGLSIVVLSGITSCEEVREAGFQITGTVRDSQSLTPLAVVDVTVADGRSNGQVFNESEVIDTTGIDGRYYYGAIGAGRPGNQLLIFRKAGYWELVRNQSDAIEEGDGRYRLDVSLEREGPPIAVDLLDWYLELSNQDSQDIYAIFTLHMRNRSGLGANINFIRVEFVRSSDGRIEGFPEIGADEVIRQTGSNRLEPNQTREETFVTGSRPSPKFSWKIHFTVSFTDDVGNKFDVIIEYP
jgi:hypothetical protein